MWTSTPPELDAVPCCRACEQVKDRLHWMEIRRILLRQQITVVSISVFGMVAAFVIVRSLT